MGDEQQLNQAEGVIYGEGAKPMSVTWAVYDRPPYRGSFQFRAEMARYRAWLSEAQTMTPTDAWRLRIEMGVPCAASDLGSQIIRLAVLQRSHTGEGPMPHPNAAAWVLDQDRRCLGEPLGEL